MGLTIAQVEKVSREVGLPSNRWDEADQWVVMAVVYAVVEDIPVAEAKALTVAELSSRMASVDADEVDPTQASG
jgi:hypothetical protein